jgi:hypothetical protein
MENELPLRKVTAEELEEALKEGQELQRILYEEFRSLFEITAEDLNLILR